MCIPVVRSAGEFQYTEKGTHAFKYLSDQQKFTISNVISIFEDSRGIIWFGGTNGQVIAYNGLTFEDYADLSAFRGKAIYDIIEDDLGQIWFATFGSGLIRFDGHSFYQYSDATGLPGERLKVLDLHLDDQGVIWAGTVNYGLLKIENSSFTQFTKKDGLCDKTISAICSGPQGSLWLGGYNGQVSKMDEDGLTNYDVADGLSGGVIHQIVLDGNTQLWLASSKGLCKLNTAGFDLITSSQGLPFDHIRSILPDNDGGLWLASYGGGLIHFDGDQSFQTYGLNSGINNLNLVSLLRDSDGFLWLGTYGSGVYRYLGEGFVHHEVGYQETTHPWSILELENGKLISGTSGNGVMELQNGVWKPLQETNFLKDNHIYDLEQRGDEIWIGTNEGAYIWKNGSFKQLRKGKELLSDQVRCFAHGPNNSWLIGTTKGLTIYSDTGWKFIDKPQGLRSHDIYQCLTDPDGDIWLATNDGLACVTAVSNYDNVHIIDLKAGLRSARIFDIDLDANGILWTASFGGGLAYAPYTALREYIDHPTQVPDEKVFENITENLGLLSNNLESVFIAEDSSIWIGSELGINRLVRTSDSNDLSSLGMRSYGIEDGIRESRVVSNNVIQDERGHLWWCTSRYILEQNPNAETIDLTPPNVMLNDIDLFYESIDWSDPYSDERIQMSSSYFGSLGKEYIHFDSLSSWTSVPLNLCLSHDQNHLTFHLIGINWQRNDEIFYRYRLNGQESDWQPTTSDNKCTYQNIPDGTYTFQVQAQNANGIWSDVASYEFTIMPPYWKTTWFIILEILVLISIIILVFRWRIQNLKRERDRLDALVQERTKELQVERDKSESLLLNILPEQTAEELKNKGYAETQYYEESSVLFSDFEGFTYLTETMKSKELVVILDRFFKAYDQAAKRYGIEKIKTIGDAYMCAGGIPEKSPHHAARLVAFGLEMIRLTDQINQAIPELAANPWKIRIGIHTGPLIAGVVGKNKFAYDIWGDTVNLAARLESTSESGRLNVSQATYDSVSKIFNATARGKLKAKNKGEIDMYFIDSFKTDFSGESQFMPGAEFFKQVDLTELETDQNT